MKIKVVIVDDEPRAHKVLENYIARIPQLELVGNFFDGISAGKYLDEFSVDLLFLDITMPECDGFALLRMLQSPPLVVFTTAHADYALESYDHDALDYLKKPIPNERFVKAVNKAIQHFAIHRPITSPQTDHIELKVGGRVRAISFKNIVYFQSLGNYVKVITDDALVLTQITTRELEDQLPPEVFIRVHKSFIVNKQKIVSVSENEIIMTKRALPIGKTFKKYVRSAFEGVRKA